MIDLRSDTLTRPTDAMREAMARAEVGDDVYGEDPTVAALEERVAGMFGHEAALFTPTGSMANVLAVASVVRRARRCCASPRPTSPGPSSAPTAPSPVSPCAPGPTPRGQVDLPAIEAMYAPDMGPFFVRTAAVSVENTHNFAGGAVLPIEDLRALRAWAETNATKVHLDGARLWNAHVATGTPLADYGRVTDVLAVCLSKGLGAPIGSLMVGSADAIAEARVRRKRMGGGMRQVGVLAAAGAYALDHHVERLADDHAHARLLGEALGLDPEASTPTSSSSSARTPPSFVERAAADGRAHRCRGTAHRAPRDPPRRLAHGRRACGRGAQPARRPLTLTSLIAV